MNAAMLLLSTKARSVALGLALTASVPPAAAAPSLRGSRALYDEGSGDGGEDGGASDWVARLGDAGCAIAELWVDPACDEPEDCDGARSFACEDLSTAEMYDVDNDLVGIATGDGAFAFEDDAGAHLLDGGVVFKGEASINLHTMSVSFISGTFHMARRAVPDLEVVPDAASYYDVGLEPSGDSKPTMPDEDEYVPSDEAVAVAGTAAVSQAGHAGHLAADKGVYEPEEPVTIDFDLAGVPGDAAGYRVGLYMRMANPQEGALPPLASLPLPPGVGAGSVTFSRESMGMMAWPLDLYEYGTGYDAYVLDGSGVDVVGPAQFNIMMEEE